MIKHIIHIVSDKFNVDGANVYFSKEYAEKQQSLGINYIFLYSDTYVIPVRISQKKIMRYAFLNSEPYKYNKDGSETIKSFLNNVCCYLKTEFKIQWISETPAYALFPIAPDGAKSIPYGSHIVNLENDEALLWEKLHSKHRNVIKKAEKDGVIILKGLNESLIQDYHSIDLQTWYRSNAKASSLENLKKLVDIIGDNIIFYIAYKDGEPQAGAIFFYNRAICYYMYGASRNKPYTGSANLLQWKAMLDMKNAGVKSYSFVGCRINEDENSKYHGIQRFKERFGGDLFIGERFKIVFNDTMYRIYKVLVSIKISLYQKHIVKYKDTIDQEYHKWGKR